MKFIPFIKFIIFFRVIVRNVLMILHVRSVRIHILKMIIMNVFRKLMIPQLPLGAN